MLFLGTAVNAAAIVAGALAGLFLRGGLRENYKSIIHQAVGLAVVFVGISGCLSNMLAPGANPVLFIISLAVGGVLGEGLGIEAALERLGGFIQNRLHKNGAESSISKGFVAASLLFCVGTMAVLGSFESGVQHRHTILYAKSLLDGIISIVMASTLGVGVLLSAGSVLVYQGTLTLLAALAGPLLTADMLREIGTVGGILIAGIGLNMLEITKLRVGNLLPALLVPVAYYVVTGLVG